MVGDDYFQGQIAGKTFKFKDEACPANAGLCVAF